jgi:hypothetical protein
MSFAVVLTAQKDEVAGVLVLLDEQSEAEAIAACVRNAGHKVEVRTVDEIMPGWKTLPSAVYSAT